MFLVAVVVAIILGFTSVGVNLTEITADILGSFIGIFAALALGEIVKEVDNILNAKRLRINLLTNMNKMVDELSPEYPTAYDTTKWDSAFSSGEINLFTRALREEFYAVYRKIQFYNNKVEVFHTNKHDPDCDPARRAQSKIIAVTFQRELIETLKGILERAKLRSRET
ncbi:MAG: hypothetical protein RTU30_08050 [Candidatus Thorarchaeota archaeon]